MKRYSVSDFRKHLARALDEVERGQTIVIDRGSRRFRLHSERVTRPAQTAAPFFELLDDSLLERGWTWGWGPKGLVFKPGGRRRRA